MASSHAAPGISPDTLEADRKNVLEPFNRSANFSLDDYHAEGELAEVDDRVEHLERDVLNLNANRHIDSQMVATLKQMIISHMQREEQLATTAAGENEKFNKAVQTIMSRWRYTVRQLLDIIALITADVDENLYHDAVAELNRNGGDDFKKGVMVHALNNIERMGEHAGVPTGLFRIIGDVKVDGVFDIGRVGNRLGTSFHEGWSIGIPDIEIGIETGVHKSTMQELANLDIVAKIGTTDIGPSDTTALIASAMFLLRDPKSRGPGLPPGDQSNFTDWLWKYFKRTGVGSAHGSGPTVSDDVEMYDGMYYIDETTDEAMKSIMQSIEKHGNLSEARWGECNNTNDFQSKFDELFPGLKSPMQLAGEHEQMKDISLKATVLHNARRLFINHAFSAHESGSSRPEPMLVPKNIADEQAARALASAVANRDGAGGSSTA